MEVTIFWTKKGREQKIRKRICEQFNLHWYMTVNGETPADIRAEDLPLLRETERRGFIQLRFKPQ